MSVHSLLGCGIHAVHAECCPNMMANCEESCSCENRDGCEQAKKGTRCCRCAASGTHKASHRKVAGKEKQQSGQNSAIRSGKTVSHNSPIIPPCQCTCNGSHCVFVVNATRPVLIDRFSLEPVNVRYATAELQCFPFLCQFSPAALDYDASQLGGSRSALTQVWLL